MQECMVEVDGALALESAIWEQKNYPFKSRGENVLIGDNVFFARPDLVEIGDNVRIDNNCHFTTQMRIGSNVHIAPFVTVTGGADSLFIMEDFSGLAAGCRVICGSDDYFEGLTNPTVPIEFRPKCKAGRVTLSRHCIAGTNTVIHPDLFFAEGACTGSYTLVTKSLIKPWTVYIGIPAVSHGARNREVILKQEQLYRDYLKRKA